MVEKSRSIGIMQGRLTESKGRGIQFFPFEEWKEEFKKAQKIELDEIEWIFDYYNYQDNPLWTKEGRSEICKLVSDTGIRVNSFCWDYFMRRPFYKYNSTEVLDENKVIMCRMLEAMQDIGASLIEIPMVDDSSVKSAEEEAAAIQFIRWACDEAGKSGIKVGIEADFPPHKFTEFLRKIGRKNVVANYDSGNSSGLGYNHREELLSLGNYVYNVHIKDRVKGNGTVRLGTGSADFDAVFGSLKEIGYANSFILQAARGEEGKELETIKEQVGFVNNYLLKYEIK